MNNIDKTGKRSLIKSPYKNNITTPSGKTPQNTNKNTNEPTSIYISSNFKQSTKSRPNVFKNNDSTPPPSISTSYHINTPITSTASPIIAAFINNATTAAINKSNEIVIDDDNIQLNTLHKHNQPFSFAAIMSKEKTSRRQTLVFNAIDGI
jgi:hypothetical protein